MPSTKYEVLLDLNGDGKCDFAFIDTTGDGTPDSFALDRTGNGELNLYFVDTDGNGLADTTLYYPDGQDTPSYTRIGKETEARIHDFIGQRIRECMTAAMKENDPQRILDTLYGIKNDIGEKAKVYGKTGTLARMRLKIKADPEMAKLLCPSPKNELFFDLNGDGITDFALIDSDHSGNLDTFAMDLYGDGEFDMYLTDLDENHIPDRALYYKTGDDEPTLGAENARLEEALRPASEKFANTLRNEFSAKSLVEALQTYKLEAIAALKVIREEMGL
jgi:heat shock protein beta